MKSTGLFGKNSGRVGGVVYSNYRGQQIVRSYQPQVKNPQSLGQIEQRAKFKLVSQSAVPLSREINLSFKPSSKTLTPRNEWVKTMLAKTTFVNGEASLLIEDLVLTASVANAIYLGTDLEYRNGRIVFGANDEQVLSNSFFDQGVGVRAVLISYRDGEAPQVVGATDLTIEEDTTTIPGDIRHLIKGELFGTNYVSGKLRLLIYAFKPSPNARAIYGDIEVESEAIKLEDSILKYNGDLVYSATRNVSISEATSTSEGD